jgi:phosphopentomutase
VSRRAAIVVLDGVGIGPAPDSDAYGDTGSDSLGNVARRVGGLALPNLGAFGLGHCAALAGVPAVASPAAAHGSCEPVSAGKDSTTGHWEICGLTLETPFPTYPDGFPQPLVDEFARLTGRGVLGNTTASGTAILDRFGEEHQRTGQWIVYTSADSVFQIAAHEERFGLDRLHDVCATARRLVDSWRIGRVIARPFVGSDRASFRRTANRRDFALPPAGETLLDRLRSSSRAVVAIGKIEDLFAGRGISTAFHTASDDEGMDRVLSQMASVPDGLIFANLVDFDTQYGHRNDIPGYAQNLERFDARLAGLLPRLRDDDLLVVTADHGNDPATPSTDHSREYVPLIAAGGRVRDNTDLGTRPTFADLGQTLADLFGVAPLAHGTSFLHDIL